MKKGIITLCFLGVWGICEAQLFVPEMKIQQTNGRIGINTVGIPEATFDVVGDGEGWSGWFKNTNGADVRLGFKEGHGIYVSSTASGNPYLLHLNDGATSRMIINKDGRVGINDGSPNSTLKVVGDGQVWTGYFRNSLGGDVRLAYKGYGIFVHSSATSGNPYLMHLIGNNFSRFIVHKNGEVGIGRGVPSGYTLAVNGSAICDGVWQPSDEKLKVGIKDYESGLNVIKQLTPKKYKYRKKQKKLLITDEEDNTEKVKEERSIIDENESIGIIAQELQNVAPDLVRSYLDEDNEEILAINQTALTYVLINAIKELNTKVDLQQQLIDKLYKGKK